jgi:signal peptidase II
VLDLLTKRAVLASMAPGERRPLVPGWLDLAYAQNTHGAMGLFGERAWLLILMAIVVVAVIAWMLRDLIRDSRPAQIGFGLMLGGAAANVVDRSIHHYVVDFIEPRWFYIFNGADACVTVGLALLAYASLRRPERA